MLQQKGRGCILFLMLTVHLVYDHKTSFINAVLCLDFHGVEFWACKTIGQLQAFFLWLLELLPSLICNSG